MLRRGGVNFYTVLFFPSPWFCPAGFSVRFLMRQYHGHPRGSIMNNIMDVHKLSINLDINRYIEYTLMYIGYECVGYVFIYTLMYSCIKPYK